MRRNGSGWLTQPVQYFAIDGGAGAHLLADLPADDPWLQRVASPHHANLLLVVEPISQKLVPAVMEIAQALAQPVHVLLVKLPLLPWLSKDAVHLIDLFPGARQIEYTSLDDLLAVMHEIVQTSLLGPLHKSEQEAVTIQMPPRDEQELATELAVLSLGPIQPFTAGPLRLFLVCDGEQVLSVQVAAGYTQRNLDQAMTQCDWRQGIQLARCFDPLAPLTSQLVYVRGLEQLQGWQASTTTDLLRNAALALEQAQNHLWWVVSFARLLPAPRLLTQAQQVARALAHSQKKLWQQPPAEWIVPQYESEMALVGKRQTQLAELKPVMKQVEDLHIHLLRDRLLALRLRGIGCFPANRFVEAGVSGPVLVASQQDEGDVQHRLLVRLQEAVQCLHQAAEAFTLTPSGPSHSSQWEVPIGEVHVSVKGPRGDIGFHLISDGSERPQHVSWHSPSAALLPLLPEMLIGQKLVDAEIIIASLDLSMMEVDG
jgi:NADH-quinone oxidoreductase subunit D